MKFAAIVCLLVVGWVLALFLRRRPNVVPALVFALGFLIFFKYISFTAGFTRGYRGTDYGFNVSLIDFAAYLLFLIAPPAARPAPFRYARYAYLAVCAASVALAPMPLYAAFSVFTLLRVYLLIDGLSRALQEERLVATLYQGLGVGIIYELATCIYQRYLLGQHQVHGTFDHQNSMGMAAYLVAALLFPVVLVGKGGRLAQAALAASMLVVVLSLSRGCMAALPIIFAIIALVSLARRVSLRKLAVITSVVVAALLVLARSFDSIMSRFDSGVDRSAESRVIFEAIAAEMVKEHPAGVGINQFSFMSSVGGYSRVADAMDASWVDRDAVVHNIYWLTLAELGFIGLIVYIILIAQPILMALVGAWRRRGELQGELLLGCFVGLIVFCYHGHLEWVARQERSMYLFWMIGVVVASLTGRLRDEARISAPTTR